MKRLLYAAIALIALGGCSSPYKATQTPDDVYYSPAQNRPAYARATEDAEGNQYVTSRDDEDYYYSKRILRFNRPYGTLGYWNDWYFGGPSASLMYTYGLGGNYGAFYDPYYAWGLPYNNLYYSPYSYYGFGYYPNITYWNGYANGYYSGKLNSYYNRPAISYGPRRSAGSNAYYNSNNGANNYRYNNNTAAPVRVFNNNGTASGNAPANNYYAPRRVFNESTNERPLIRESNDSRNFRTFESRPFNNSRSFDNAPIRMDNNSNYNNNTNSNSNSGGSAPVRTFRPRGGG